MPSPPSYGCCTRVNFVLKKHLLFQMNLSNSGLKNRSIKEYWLIFTVLKFPLGLQFSHNLTKFKINKYISTIIHHDNYMYIFTAVNSGERCGPWASCYPASISFLTNSTTWSTVILISNFTIILSDLIITFYFYPY